MISSIVRDEDFGEFSRAASSPLKGLSDEESLGALAGPIGVTGVGTKAEGLAFIGWGSRERHEAGAAPRNGRGASVLCFSNWHKHLMNQNG
jgi:hypothetical protein